MPNSSARRRSKPTRTARHHLGSSQRAVAPKVSICVPIYNSASVISATLDTLVAQRGVDYELVLVDNASTDGTTAILEGYANRYRHLIRLIKKTSTTHSVPNWNRALSEGRGAYVALYHADDLYAPTIAAEQAAFLDANPQAVAVFTDTQVVSDSLKPLGHIRAPGPTGKELYDRADVVRSLALQGYNFLVCPTFMARRSALGAAPWFDSRWWFAFDIDYYLRLLRKGPVGVVRKLLHRYRRISGAGSVMIFTRHLAQNEIYPLLDEHLAEMPGLLSPAERRRYEAFKTADWWPIVINAQASGKPAQADQLWKSHFSLGRLLSVMPYPRLWPKALMAIGFAAARPVGLAKPWAELVLRYRVYKQTGTWAAPPPRREM